MSCRMLMLQLYPTLSNAETFECLRCVSNRITIRAHSLSVCRSTRPMNRTHSLSLFCVEPGLTGEHQRAQSGAARPRVPLAHQSDGGDAITHTVPLQISSVQTMYRNFSDEQASSIAALTIAHQSPPRGAGRSNLATCPKQ